MAVYSLTHYQVVVELPEKMKQYLTEDQRKSGLVIGGTGSYLDKIEVGYNSDTWTVTGDYTGSYIHTMNGDRTGTVTISVSQVAGVVKLLQKLIMLYYQTTENKGAYENIETFPTITINDAATGEVVVTCIDNHLKKAPNIVFGNEPAHQEWEFLSGQITINR